MGSWGPVIVIQVRDAVSWDQVLAQEAVWCGQSWADWEGRVSRLFDGLDSSHEKKSRQNDKPNDLVTATGRKELPCPLMRRLVVEKTSHAAEGKIRNSVLGMSWKVCWRLGGHFKKVVGCTYLISTQLPIKQWDVVSDKIITFIYWRPLVSSAVFHKDL